MTDRTDRIDALARGSELLCRRIDLISWALDAPTQPEIEVLTLPEEVDDGPDPERPEDDGPRRVVPEGGL